VFVDENSRTRTARAENTSAFIATEVNASQARLRELEAKLRQAKEEHMGQLPEQTQANLHTLTGLRQQLEANATGLRGEQDRLSMIERQLEDMKQGSTNVIFTARGDSSQPATAEGRLATLERDLAAARTVYTDRHPEVKRLEEELVAARKEAVADRERPEEDRLAQLRMDPTYRQLVADRELARLRIRDLQRAEADTRRQIGMYQARVELAPRVEQQLASVQREYDLEREQYSQLSSKLHTAAIAENMERDRRGEQFMVMYAAALPQTPVKPIPWRVMLVAVMVGLCAGGAATLGREYLDRSVHDVRDLRDEFELPVLGEVGPIQTV
jgi:succinoglycan biosynthesis transport protein ExoP